MPAFIQALIDRFLLWLTLKSWTGRVRIGAVREAMRQTKLGLFRGGFFSKSGGACCPLAHLVSVVRPGDQFSSSGIVLHCFPKLDSSYINGFTLGYDHGFLVPEHLEFGGALRTKRYMRGYRDGQRIYQKLFEGPRQSGVASLSQ